MTNVTAISSQFSINHLYCINIFPLLTLIVIRALARRSVSKSLRETHVSAAVLILQDFDFEPWFAPSFLLSLFDRCV